MSGPPYPPAPGAGSNAIGTFTIGVSPIGDIPAFNYWNTIESQYANSPIITTIIGNAAQYIDPTAELNSFFDLIWDVDQAQGYGLDVWGRIVGVTRYLNVSAGNWLGFAEALPGSWTFGQGSFYSGQSLTTNFALSDQSFRTLIFAKAMANITDGSIPSINQILMSLFPNRGNAYVTEGAAHSSYFGFAESQNASGFNQNAFYNGQSLGYMSMTYTFNFQLSPVELAIVQQSGVLPRPTGVAATVVIL